jgi:hypothetical protein
MCDIAFHILNVTARTVEQIEFADENPKQEQEPRAGNAAPGNTSHDHSGELNPEKHEHHRDSDLHDRIPSAEDCVWLVGGPSNDNED